MIKDWIDTTIGEQVTLQRGIDITKAAQRPGSVPVISSGGVASYHDTAFAKGPGVVLGRKGVVGSVYYIDVDYWPHDTSLWVRDFHGNSPRFVYYFFRHMAPELASMDVGSANPTLNRNHVHPKRTKWPPLSEQRAIAHILGTLDDKIELNRQMNQTLDELARTIFRSWFVDFDPVRAKAEGREPEGMDAETADLFPDRFVDSTLGPIPEGWEVQPIGAMVTVVGGSTPSTKQPEFWEGGTHLWATPKDLSGIASPILIDTARRITDAGVQQISSRLLPVGSVLLSSRAPVGYLAVTTEPTAINQGFIGMICDRGVPNAFVLNWARERMDTIKGNAGGTTFAEISKTAFRPILGVRPSHEVLDTFQLQTSALYELIETNLRESVTLADLRDTLLSELLSGRIDSSSCGNHDEQVTRV
ncbi:MAG: restriction endonuclease subunit S [Thermomicrobiales bacterium]